MNRLVTAESSHLNYRAGMAEADLWYLAEQNEPRDSCEAMVGGVECCAYDWELIEAGQYETVWKCQRCKNRITQEAE